MRVAGASGGGEGWWDLGLKTQCGLVRGADYSTFCLSLSPHFLCQKWGENASKLVSACLFVALREERGLRADGSRKPRLGPLSSSYAELG